MAINLRTQNSQTIKIDSKPIHSGGEGAIHRVIGTGRNMVAKIYHKGEKANEFHSKILFMVKNPPFGQAPKEIRDAIVWPEDLLFKNDEFVGYLMPEINQGIKLFSLTLPNSRYLKFGQQWSKFDTTDPNAFLIRLKICYNLASAIEVLHRSGQYVLVDLKPDNLLIKLNGSFSLIDLDSIQISHNQQLLYRATAYTPEYLAPEAYGGRINLSHDKIPVSFDLFSFAVIIYQLLFSIHPFQASHLKFTTLEENIKHGLFVHGSKKNQLHVIPKIHEEFNNLPASLQQLFIRALCHGNVNPSFRPTASEWVNVLLGEIKNFDTAKNLVYSNKRNKGMQNQSVNKVNQNIFPSQLGSQKYIVNSIKNITKVQHPSLHPSSTNRFQNQVIGQNPLPNGILAVQNFLLKSKLQANRILPVLKKVAMVLLAIIVATILWRSVSPNLQSLKESDNSIVETGIGELISGQYFGFIQTENLSKQVAYLNIIKSNEYEGYFLIQVITSMLHGAEVEKIRINSSENTFNSIILGEGMVRRKQDGKITLVSTENNSMLWYFEK